MNLSNLSQFIGGLIRNNYIIFVVGRGGVGKDYVVSEICKRVKAAKRAVSYTTREKREGEEEGKNYYYVGKAAFDILNKNGELASVENHMGKQYGFPKSSLSSHNLFIVTPSGVKNLKELTNRPTYTLLVDASDKTIQARLAARDLVWIHKFNHDKEKFSDFSNYDFKFNNEQENPL